ncbi:plasmid mobilization relaxosome protein MobC [Sinomicrobium sp. FJxs]|uniref:Plasmid mobilization relaxosome protein MobC n=2 Tax=Sinomicrobium weinanense TaxID=2842200 RepID=A0A926Q352_9FLAO|nr:plasmid mobilization relaxosome protein MobC [Sinomicrobium weinanense]MBU3122900.1 plasmid mobilization relaxosome protein MobC [Sinomicrobium weinanense]
MKKEKTSRTRVVHVRLTPGEYQKLQREFQKTTCRKLSHYLRHCLLERPVVTTYRNTSLDDFIEEFSLLRSELNRIGTNYNQVVKKLHALKRIEDFKPWLSAYQTDKITLLEAIAAIENHLQKAAESWLQ